MRDNKPFARTSKLGVTSYARPKKKLISMEERKQMKDSLSIKKWNGGDDIA